MKKKAKISIIVALILITVLGWIMLSLYHHGWQGGEEAYRTEALQAGCIKAVAKDGKIAWEWLSPDGMDLEQVYLFADDVILEFDRRTPEPSPVEMGK